MNNRKILLVHEYCGFIGGIERYIFDTVLLLKKKGFVVWGLFEKELEQNSAKFKSPFDKTLFSSCENLTTEIPTL